MKKIIGILVALMMCFTLTSCVTTAQAQVDGVYDDVDVSVIVTYGTPYYNAEGLLMYYIYRDLYYYPYIHNNRYYFHRYHRPLPPHRIGIHKPIPRDFYHHQPKPYRPHISQPNRGIHHNHRPNVQPRSHHNIGGGNHHRSMNVPRSSTRYGSFGGKRH